MAGFIVNPGQYPGIGTIHAGNYPRNTRNPISQPVDIAENIINLKD
jgi:hypothetical protein